MNEDCKGTPAKISEWHDGILINLAKDYYSVIKLIIWNVFVEKLEPEGGLNLLHQNKSRKEKIEIMIIKEDIFSLSTDWRFTRVSPFRDTTSSLETQLTCYVLKTVNAPEHHLFLLWCSRRSPTNGFLFLMHWSLLLLKLPPINYHHLSTHSSDSSSILHQDRDNRLSINL